MREKSVTICSLLLLLQIEDNYVARRKAHGEQEYQSHYHGTVDYNVGHFAPHQGVGKFVFNVNNKEKVSARYAVKMNCNFFKPIFLLYVLKEYNDGEILVESEPIRYELRDIKRDKFRQSIVRNLTIMGTTQLFNDGDEETSAAEAMSYGFSKKVYWTADGVARGKPTNVYERGADAVELAHGWGFEDITNITQVRSY